MATSAGEGRGLGRAGHRGLRGAGFPHTTAVATGREVGWPWWEGLSETPGLIQGFSKLAVSGLRGGEPAGWARLQSPSWGCGGGGSAPTSLGSSVRPA